MPTKQTWFSKNSASMPQNLAFTPNKQKSTLMPKNRLPCHKQNLAPMPQFLALMPQNQKLGFHATKIGSYAKNQLLCHKQTFGSYATKIQLSCHSKFGFQVIKKPGFLPQNLAFMPKTNLWQKIFTKWQPFDQILKQTFPSNFYLRSFKKKRNLSETREYKKGRYQKMFIHKGTKRKEEKFVTKLGD